MGQTIVRPQPGPQSSFLSTPADIAIYGGAARGGKTWGLLMEPLRHNGNSKFSATFFRRTYTEIMMSGGAWEEAAGLYQPLGARFSKSPQPLAKFPSGMEVRFSHLHNEADVYNYQGSKLPLQLYDEITHFTEAMFWYMVSRSTGTCGVTPYIRASCNPVVADDPVGGWVNALVSWYLDEKGYADRSKSGIIRWFYRQENSLLWYPSRAAAMAANPELVAAGAMPKSFTFIPALLEDNAAQLAADPGYRSNLMSLPLVEREQLLGGNWHIRHCAGTLFNRAWFRITDAAPIRFTRVVRYWDKAGADKTNKLGDFSAGVLGGLTANGEFFVLDCVRGKWSPFERNTVIAETARMDRQRFPGVELWIEQEPGNGGKESAMISVRDLREYGARVETPRIGKTARAGHLSAQCEAGNVKLVQAPWNKEFIDELSNFPTEGWHDDQVDAASGAFNKCVSRDGDGHMSVKGSV